MNAPPVDRIAWFTWNGGHLLRKVKVRHGFVMDNNNAAVGRV